VPDRQKVDHSLRRIEGVNHAVITYTETVTIASSKSVMRECVQPQPHFVDASLDPSPDSRWEVEKRGVKPRVTDL